MHIAVPVKRSRARRSRDPGPADPLFDALREIRRAIATESGVPPYVIFHDSTLRAIAAERPASLSALARIPGVGEAKLQRYGEAMLAVVAQQLEVRDHASA